MDNNEFEMNFSDLTIIETEGKYDEVKKIMDEELSPNSKWMIRSELTIESRLGFCYMALNFHNNGDVYIDNYETTSGDVYYNPDIRCLSVWAQENGWNVPKPNDDLVRADKELWKHFWETRLVDCNYLEQTIGNRSTIDIEVEEDFEFED